MGISDDIRPKTFRPISKKVVKTEIKVARKEIDERDDGQLFKEPHDGDFFSNTPIGKRERKNKENTVSDESKKAGGHRWVYTLIIILAICTLIGLVIWQNYSTIKSYLDGSYKSKNSQNLTDIINSTNDSAKNYESAGQSATGSSAATTTQQPAAVTTPAVDKSIIVISVLNGSGIKSAASTVTGTLKTAGFTVKNTSNARSFNYTKTYIYYKTDDPANANLVKDSLPTRATEIVKNASVVGATYDIVVVVGKT